MKKYEYKVITIPTGFAMNSRQYETIALEFEARLNELGAEGWELVQRIDGFFFFKRECESCLNMENLQENDEVSNQRD